ncbi:major tropism determinant [Synechococcus phage S-CBS1]|uniref:tail protein n=1 Tax=Synechococcus phage S-CBS1 TaxID=909297 RepID=UPI000231E283|nr:tail protein [Synechococcus phage S-CBS1]ADP06612.1 major tropism determinant [Synechococcus phage S-CBS1]
MAYKFNPLLGVGLNDVGEGSAAVTVYGNRRPPLHRGPLFYKTAATTISVTAGSVLNGVVYDLATAVTMPGSFNNNTDYAIWQHPTTGALVADASFTSAPAGAAGGSIVGGFHYIPSGRPTAVNSGSPTATAEILEYSIWDLTWRPTCPDPRGMTCVDGRFWCDLYFCGSTSYAGSDFTAVPSSKIGLTIADKNNPPRIPAIYGGNGTTTYSNVDSKEPGSWYDFAEVASSFGKRLISWLEFQHAAFGGPENNSRNGDPGTVIWERVSLWGLAQSTGTLYSWGSDVRGDTYGPWQGGTGNRGDVYGSSIAAVTLGGRWNLESTGGSRAANWSFAPSDAYEYISARFAAEHLVTC